jgi:hypothetical protein
MGSLYVLKDKYILQEQDGPVQSRSRSQSQKSKVKATYIPQEQGGPVIPPGTGFPSRYLDRALQYGRVIEYCTVRKQSFFEYVTNLDI